MDQLGDELKKVLKAGLGAVAAGVEKTQEAIETLSRKGEPIYEQAKSAVCDAAGKIKKAVDDSGISDAFSGKIKVEEIIDSLRRLPPEDWRQVRAAIDEWEAQAAETGAQETDGEEKQE